MGNSMKKITNSLFNHKSFNIIGLFFIILAASFIFFSKIAEAPACTDENPHCHDGYDDKGLDEQGFDRQGFNPETGDVKSMNGKPGRVPASYNDDFKCADICSVEGMPGTFSGSGSKDGNKVIIKDGTYTSSSGATASGSFSVEENSMNIIKGSINIEGSIVSVENANGIIISGNRLTGISGESCLINGRTYSPNKPFEIILGEENEPDTVILPEGGIVQNVDGQVYDKSLIVKTNRKQIVLLPDKRKLTSGQIIMHPDGHYTISPKSLFETPSGVTLRTSYSSTEFYNDNLDHSGDFIQEIKEEKKLIVRSANTNIMAGHLDKDTGMMVWGHDYDTINLAGPEDLFAKYSIYSIQGNILYDNGRLAYQEAGAFEGLGFSRYEVQKEGEVYYYFEFDETKARFSAGIGDKEVVSGGGYNEVTLASLFGMTLEKSQTLEEKAEQLALEAHGSELKYRLRYPFGLENHKDEAITIEEFTNNLGDYTTFNPWNAYDHANPDKTEDQRYIQHPTKPEIVIDMQHFIKIGSISVISDTVGDAVEWQQGFGEDTSAESIFDSSSGKSYYTAADPQDYYSNRLGAAFFRCCYNPFKPMGSQISDFLKKQHT